MTVRKRALGALAAGALLVPLLPITAAYAAGDEPPAVQSIAEFCADVSTTNPFTDIAGNTHERAIECAFAAEITNGGPEELPESQYGPFRNVRRDQMASFIARMIDTANELDCDNSVTDLPVSDKNESFRDVDTTNTHYDAIARLEDAGIVLGGPGALSDDFYGPALNVQRDQMASFINRAVRFMTGEALGTTADYFTDDEASTHEANINGIASAGITNGFGPDTYGPYTSVPRDQMASFIIRALADLNEKDAIVALKEDCADTSAPTLVDAQVATEPAGATGAATAEDVIELTFSEDIATDGATATDNALATDTAIATDAAFTVEDEDGDTALIQCGIQAGGADLATAADCAIDGAVLTVTLLEDAQDTNVGSGNDDGLQFPLTITDIFNVSDGSGNEAVLPGSTDVVIDDESTV